MHTVLKCSFCILSGLQLIAQDNAQHNDQAAIRKVVSTYLSAREHDNAQELASLFTDDADQLVSSGEWRRGRAAIVKGTLASSARTGGTRSITLDSIRFITPLVAIADGRYELTGLAGGTSRNMWTTFVVTKTAGGWRIAAIRNMLPAAPAPAAGKLR
ncbi:MAG: SgcJ/EcaC family oxidoreductase [Acidobacteriaceae bacterium]|nr:SgcJ/EcaC family oxidoreductase [Acidobacteriaceae bacterium]MBV9499295.1 SgcJ/EcaC family oxidoreductase [Acidobacteriaceae bacterium]